MSISNVSTWTVWTRSTSVVSVAPRVTGRAASCWAAMAFAAFIQRSATSASDATIMSAFFTLPTLSRRQRLRITCKGDQKKGPPFGGPSAETRLGLLGETREDRLGGSGRVVVDRDVPVLDVHGPRDQLATG